jgi:uncharacterized protein
MPGYGGGVDAVALADYRERVARMYLADTDLAAFRRARDELFRTHPQSALPVADRAGFRGLPYFPESDTARVVVSMTPVGPSPAETGSCATGRWSCWTPRGES